MNFGLMDVHGGAKDNAIPVDSHTTIVVEPEDVEAVYDVLEDFQAAISNEFRTSDPDIQITAQTGNDGEYEVFTMPLAEKVIFMLMQVPNGIQTMSADLPGLVESSLNLGILETGETGVSMTWAIRSSVKSLKILMRDKLQYMTELFGGEISFHGDYPEWPFNPDSEICKLSMKLYKEMFKKDGLIETIHAGLECGLLSEKMPGLDMVSMGPEMQDIHTSRERLNIASVERTYALVLAILKEFKNFCH
jgi:dipeptidase D